MRTTQSGHKWYVDDAGDIRIMPDGTTNSAYLDEMDLVGMLRKVRLARMEKQMEAVRNEDPEAPVAPGS